MNKHILFLCSWYPNRYNITLGNFIQNHAHCASSIVNVSTLFVCSAKEDLDQIYFLERQTWGRNILSINIYYKNSRNPFLKMYRYLTAHLHGVREIQKSKGNINLLHLNVIKPAGIIALYLKWFSSLDFIITEHSTLYLPENAEKLSYHTKALTWLCLKNAKMLTTVTKHLGQSISKIAQTSQLQIINNVVNEELFFPSKNISIISKFRFIHISTLVSEHKNPIGIIHAFDKLYKLRQDFELLIISDGDTTITQKYIVQLGLENCIQLESTKTMAEIATNIRQSNCLVLFSNYENMPVVISEAWMCGIPVISTDVGGIAEHVNFENGILVKKGEIDDLFNSLNKMIKSRDYFTEKKSVITSYAQKQFSDLAIREQLKNIYKLQ